MIKKNKKSKVDPKSSKVIYESEAFKLSKSRTKLLLSDHLAIKAYSIFNS